jgi:hypothetical protein
MGLQGVEIGMLRCRLASAPLIAGLLVAGCAGASAAEPRALLELFTSQGCSSCPAADKLLGELAGDSSLVVLSVPIDYWDYLGWKDTLAIPGHAARQRAYAHVRGDRQVYTPQIVVNGATHVLGSDRAAIERAITVTDRNAAVMSVPVQLSADSNYLSVKIGPSEKDRASGEVWLCPLDQAVQVAIGRGENSGRNVTYHNVVRRWLKLGDFAGASPHWNVPISEIIADGSNGVAVLVQEGSRDKPGIILGAAFLAIGRQAMGPQATGDAVQASEAK